jgi:hypothetical protein
LVTRLKGIGFFSKSSPATRTVKSDNSWLKCSNNNEISEQTGHTSLKVIPLATKVRSASTFLPNERTTLEQPVLRRASFNEQLKMNAPVVNMDKEHGVEHVALEEGNNRFVAEIAPKVYLGNAKATKSIDLLKSMYITDIVQIGIVSNEQHSGIQYKNWHAADDPKFELYDLFDTIADYICQIIKKRRRRVMIIDESGISISPTIGIAFLMREHGKTFAQALDIIKGNLPHIELNPGFVDQLKDFDLDMEEERASRK